VSQSASQPTSLLRGTATCATLLATVVGFIGFASHAFGGELPPAPKGSAPVNLHPAASKGIKKWLETGQASWYGPRFQGRKTATGEVYDMNGLTCAHPSLPLGSWVRITNLRNRKSIVVRVNDRGPSFGQRIVDLSAAAARAVGLRGIGKVKLERVSTDDPEVQQVLLARIPASPFTPLSPLRTNWQPSR
jgi:rare lipoprotein A